MNLVSQFKKPFDVLKCLETPGGQELLDVLKRKKEFYEKRLREERDPADLHRTQGRLEVLDSLAELVKDLRIHAGEVQLGKRQMKGSLAK